MTADPRLTVADVAARWATSERYVLDELRRKHLRGAKLGRHWSVLVSDLERYEDAKANVAPVRGRSG